MVPRRHQQRFALLLQTQKPRHNPIYCCQTVAKANILFFFFLKGKLWLQEQNEIQCERKQLLEESLNGDAAVIIESHMRVSLG